MRLWIGDDGQTVWFDLAALTELLRPMASANELARACDRAFIPVGCLSRLPSGAYSVPSRILPVSRVGRALTARWGDEEAKSLPVIQRRDVARLVEALEFRSSAAFLDWFMDEAGKLIAERRYPDAA